MSDIDHLRELSQGNLYAIVSPSGAGKNALEQMVNSRLEGDRKLVIPVSATSRAREQRDQVAEIGDIRPYKAYCHLSKAEFEQKIDQGEFLEYAMAHGNYYGTPILSILRPLEAGRKVLLEIEYQGIEIIRRELDLKVIFIAPAPLNDLDSNLQILERRILRRWQESGDVIDRGKLATRLGTTKTELEWARKNQGQGWFDFVINREGQLEQASQDFIQLIFG